jgi:dUTP pyrophosphatase
MIRLKRIGNHDLPLPNRATSMSAGYDLMAVTDVTIPPGQVVKVPTGFAWEIDAETDKRGPILPTVNVGLVRDRSGMATKTGLHVVAGVVDGDFRGEVLVALRNAGDKPERIKAKHRIAQMIITVAYAWEVEEAEALSETGRGDGGFESTGA